MMSALLKSSLPAAMRALNRGHPAHIKPILTLAEPSCLGQTRNKSDASLKDLGQYESVEARTIEFSSSRTRDYSGAAMEAAENGTISDHQNDMMKSSAEDVHVESYDSHGSISLNSVMQSQVPEPYTTQGKAPTHLNMPGGHVGQGYKYLSDHLQETHYSRNSNSRELHTSATPFPAGMSSAWHAVNVLQARCGSFHVLSRMTPLTGLTVAGGRRYPTESKPDTSARPQVVSAATHSDVQVLTPREKLKRAVKEYGTTVIVFHVGISLMSLGGFYMAVSSGLDLVGLLQSLGVGQMLTESKLASGASTFVVAYAVHKVFAPVRIGITLTATPFIVRYLRKIGFLKPPKQQ